MIWAALAAVLGALVGAWVTWWAMTSRLLVRDCGDHRWVTVEVVETGRRARMCAVCRKFDRSMAPTAEASE